MIKTIAGIVGGLIVWIIVATIVNLLFRVSWLGYAEAEISMTFTLAMMAARLLLGALSSLCAGLAARSCCGAAIGQCTRFALDTSPGLLRVGVESPKAEGAIFVRSTI